MSINVLTVENGASVKSEQIGTWTAGLNNAIQVSNEDTLKNLSAATVYRIFTVVVSLPIFSIMPD